MKIYQIHETYGDYEDYTDNIVASYLSKEKAEEELARLRAIDDEKEHARMRCASCSLSDWLKPDEFEAYKHEACPNFKRVDSDGEISCDETYSYYDEHNYRLEEVEVIE